MLDRHTARSASWASFSLALLGLCTARCSPYSAEIAPTPSEGDAAPPSVTSDGGDTGRDGADANSPTPGDGAGATLDSHTDGSFESSMEAAFDGVVDQTSAQSATTPIYQNLDDEPLLFREYRCEVALQRVEVHPPSDGYFLHDANNYPTGGTGTVELVGRRASSSSWSRLRSLPFGTSGPVVFDAETIGNRSDYVAYGVRFVSDQPQMGTLRVAEVVFQGYCASPVAEIAWTTGDWLCHDVECTAANNPGGTSRRSVSCTRSTGGTAHEALCTEEKPTAVDGACALSCPHTLRYIGARDFTYDNGSGWLHEGRVGHRAGPLPSAVENGATRSAIEGKPCSVPTANAGTYFVGMSCREENSLYCAFRCE